MYKGKNCLSIWDKNALSFVKEKKKKKKRGEKEQRSNKDKKADGYMSEKKMSENKKGAPTFIGKELDGINTLLRGG